MRRYLVGASIAVDGESAEQLRQSVERLIRRALGEAGGTAVVEVSHPIDLGPAEGQSTAREDALFTV